MADQLAPVQQFEYLPGMNLRVLNRGGEPWFVAKDTCAALGMKNPADYLRHLDPEEKGKEIVRTPGPIGKGVSSLLIPLAEGNASPSSPSPGFTSWS